MPKIRIGRLCEAMGGHLIQGKKELPVKGIMSRWAGVVPGLLYFDVKGGKGGDSNILNALQNGAVGVVISKHKKVLPFNNKDIAVIAVPKVWEAFWQTVSFYRNLYDVKVVGVTGTSGKTTTKEMLASIFRRRWKTLKTVGNMNLPEFVPSHIMRLKWGYEAAVFEIGMNRPGQVSKQAKVIRPRVGIITHIGPGHVEHLGSLENVISEKAGIMVGIPDDGYLILNADDANTRKIDLSSFKGKVLRYSLQNPADITARDIRQESRGIRFKAALDGQDHEFFIPVLGRHNVSNALAAISAARLFGVELPLIKKGLRCYRRPAMRLQIVKGIRDSILINDTYNANPDSVEAGLEVLAGMAKGRTGVAVLGDMLEQGKYAVENHRRVGRRAAKLGIDWLVTVGPLAREIATGAAQKSQRMKIWSFRIRRQAVKFLRSQLPGNSVVLIKGSRGSHMEGLVRGLKAESAE